MTKSNKLTTKKLPNFNQLFNLSRFTDDFSWSPKWNEEVEKWLSFIEQKDSRYYQTHKNRAKNSKQRDELLGEYKAAYFIEKKCGGQIVEFEPNGISGKKLDLLFKDKKGVEWFTEIKSPSWRNQVAKEVERDFLKKLRGDGVRMRLDVRKSSNEPKYIGTISCPKCQSDIDIKIRANNFERGLKDDQLKKAKCSKCNKNIWKFSENERSDLIRKRLSRPQFVTGDFRWVSGDEAIEDAIRKSIQQFSLGENNLLVVTPNMFSDAGLLAAMDEGHGVKKLLEKHDPQKVITCILILEVSLPANSKNFNYIDIWISAKNKKPKL